MYDRPSPKVKFLQCGICRFQNEFTNYFPCTETTNTKQREQESKQHIHIISCWGSSVTKMSPKYIGQAT